MKPLLVLTLLVSLVSAQVSARPAAAQITDAQLAERIADTVRQYVHFSIFDDVSIEVDNRTVTLTGRVTMPYKRGDIESRVVKLDGVRTVVNKIEVLPVSIVDSNLRDRIARAIYGNPAFRHYAAMGSPPIHIIVEGAHVTLTGVVASPVESMLAYSLAQVPGTLGVKNQIKTDR
jgi:osmotically-inducible protein OsmY